MLNNKYVQWGGGILGTTLLTVGAYKLGKRIFGTSEKTTSKKKSKKNRSTAKTVKH
jgi:hypothetical protein